ncbi:MAG: MBL fold metallo-hydrolase [Ruminococcaceae bacterium]|nr:MBL fold metallo-hydrolase [Oscillospiraceae bacterium]
MSRIHQLKTEGVGLDGMAYVIEADDGSVIAIDGGFTANDGRNMFNYLCRMQNTEHPVVDAWFISHAHPDHTRALKTVADEFSDRITVKKTVYSFPDMELCRRIEPDCLFQIPEFEKSISSLCAEHVVPKAGDVYHYGEDRIEIMLDWTELPSSDEEPLIRLNDTTTVFRYYSHGQSVIFLGDVMAVGDKVLIEKYGKDLKSDVCQLAHHGFFASTKEFYSYVDPEIVLWPVGLYQSRRTSVGVPATRYVITELNVKDFFIAGAGDAVLELPIRPRPEPYIPEVRVGLRESQPETFIPFTKNAPSLDDYSDPLWELDDERVMNNKSHACTNVNVSYRFLATEEALYLRFKVEKNEPFSFAENNVSCKNADCVRLDLCEEPVFDYLITWDDIASERNFNNLKMFFEEKRFKDKKCFNSMPEICQSKAFLDGESGIILARVAFSERKKSGDMIAFHSEANLVNPSTLRRKGQLVALEDEKRSSWYLTMPAVLIYAELK